MTLGFKRDSASVPHGENEIAWESLYGLKSLTGWSEAAFLALSRDRGLEFNDGTIEVLPVPTLSHQLIVGLFYRLLTSFVGDNGLVLLPGYKIRVKSKTVSFREPDVVYMTAAQSRAAGEQFTAGAELIAEVVSPDDPARDYKAKRDEYAAANVPEYWILDPISRQIVVLILKDGRYAEHGRYGAGETAVSHRLPGFVVRVDDMLALNAPANEADAR